jgi:hypothetical protein
MTIFRWIIGVFSSVMAVAAIGSFILFLISDSPLWLRRTRRFRHWTWLALLLWFNIEVWGRVVYTLVHWNG